MFTQNFVKLSAAVHELSCSQRNKKLIDDAENNTAVASAGSNKDHVNEKCDDTAN